jgi:predicted RNase H-like HicB family nuclease
MEYTVVITKEPDARWRAVASELPECAVEAPTRDEALARIKERIAEASQHIEVLKIEVPDSPNGNGAPRDSIKSLMGLFKDDPTWGEMFDEIERRRDQHWAGE